MIVCFTWAHCVELHDAESEHCESEFEFEFCDRYDNPESTPLSMWGVLESFFPLESDFIEPPPSLTTFEFITLKEKVTKRLKMVENLNLEGVAVSSEDYLMARSFRHWKAIMMGQYWIASLKEVRYLIK